MHDESISPLPLDVRGLRKSFRGRTRVDGVAFTVRPGRVVGLLGPNGAEKTTTIRLLLGLASRNSGDALVFGRRYRDLERPARTVGAVLDSGGLHLSRTGRQHLRIAAARAGVDRARVDAVLAEVAMTGEADRRAAGVLARHAPAHRDRRSTARGTATARPGRAPWRALMRRFEQRRARLGNLLFCRAIDESARVVDRSHERARSAAMRSTAIPPEDAYLCRALESAALGLLNDHLNHCVLEAAAAGGDEAKIKLQEAFDAIARLARS